MKAKWYPTGLAVVLALGLSAWSDPPRPADAKSAAPAAMLQALAEAGKPGAAHARLQPLAGSWTYTCKMWMDPGQPPVETAGTLERRWILGGRFLEERFAGTGLDGKPGFEAVGLIGYDNGRREYTSAWACTMGTGVSTGVGTAESTDRFVFQNSCACPLSKTPVLRRDEIRIESADRVVTEAFVSENGKDLKVMEIVATRKK